MNVQLNPSRQVLDPRAYGKIRDLEQYTKPGVSALITSFFLRQAPKWLATIEEGFLSGHQRSIILAAHSLKAASGTLGAFRLYDAASQIVPVLESGNIQAAEELLAKLASEWEAAKRLLQRETFS